MYNRKTIIRICAAIFIALLGLSAIIGCFFTYTTGNEDDVTENGPISASDAKNLQKISLFNTGCPESRFFRANSSVYSKNPVSTSEVKSNPPPTVPHSSFLNLDSSKLFPFRRYPTKKRDLNKVKTYNYQTKRIHLDADLNYYIRELNVASPTGEMVKLFDEKEIGTNSTFDNFYCLKPPTINRPEQTMFSGISFTNDSTEFIRVTNVFEIKKSEFMGFWNETVPRFSNFESQQPYVNWKMNIILFESKKLYVNTEPPSIKNGFYDVKTSFSEGESLNTAEISNISTEINLDFGMTFTKTKTANFERENKTYYESNIKTEENTKMIDFFLEFGFRTIYCHKSQFITVNETFVSVIRGDDVDEKGFNTTMEKFYNLVNIEGIEDKDRSSEVKKFYYNHRETRNMQRQFLPREHIVGTEGISNTTLRSFGTEITRERDNTTILIDDCVGSEVLLEIKLENTSVIRNEYGKLKITTYKNTTITTECEKTRIFYNITDEYFERVKYSTTTQNNLVNSKWTSKFLSTGLEKTQYYYSYEKIMAGKVVERKFDQRIVVFEPLEDEKKDFVISSNNALHHQISYAECEHFKEKHLKNEEKILP